LTKSRGACMHLQGGGKRQVGGEFYRSQLHRIQEEKKTHASNPKGKKGELLAGVREDVDRGVQKRKAVIMSEGPRMGCLRGKWWRVSTSWKLSG